ncbi:hypothetical protein A0H81_12032 [Grifola frondosa]|uniref:Uncharacterized protein n=1 Tax=Grifola frondosa TaxID=5627 RepID=A0A1C7LZ25_GRIFR|nr:hypothetical protein A0H81_12032 [Grifola frondosa]
MVALTHPLAAAPPLVARLCPIFQLHTLRSVALCAPDAAFFTAQRCVGYFLSLWLTKQKAWPCPQIFGFLTLPDLSMPGAGTLNVRAARPRHWAASAFLAVLGMVANGPVIGCAALKRFLCDGAPRNYAGALLNVSPPIVRFAGISSECVNVHAARAFHTRLSRVLATPRTARTFGCAGARASAHCMLRVRSVGHVALNLFSRRALPYRPFGHGTLVELYIYHTAAGLVLLRAHAACSSLWPNGHATGHIVAFRALACIRGSSPWIVGAMRRPAV